MKIIATQGPGHYLLALDPTDTSPTAQGQIIHTRRGVAYPAQSIQSILARGYWEDTTFTDEQTATILANISMVGR